MKDVKYAFIVFVLMLQSCSHIVYYSAAEYHNEDSPYTVEPMLFAYYANGKSISSSLAQTGDRIYHAVTSDSLFKVYLQSAASFEEQATKDVVHRRNYDNALSECKNVYESSIKSNDHETVISDLNKQMVTLDNHKTADFKDYWKKVGQLSHWGIIQHYAVADDYFMHLNNTDRALVYGYILRKDLAACIELSEKKVKSDADDLASLSDNMKKEITRRENKIKEIERKKKEEAERIRKQQAEEERIRQEQIRREQAQLRWNDDSWIDGKWQLQLSNTIMVTLYIDANNKKIKLYTRNIYDTSYPRPDYNGNYHIENGTDEYRGYKILFFGGNFALLDPDYGFIYDVSGTSRLRYHRSF